MVADEEKITKGCCEMAVAWNCLRWRWLNIISSMKIAVLGALRHTTFLDTSSSESQLANIEPYVVNEHWLQRLMSRRSAEHITKQAGLRSNWIQLGGFSTLEIAQMMCPLHPFASFLFPVELIEPHFSFHERAPLYGFYLVFYPFPYTLALERARLL